MTMPDLAGPSGPQTELDAFARTMFDLGGFQPPIEELPGNRAYLAEIRAAIQQLPEIDGVDDEIEIGFDPTWPETES
jgi:hypothetical protein